MLSIPGRLLTCSSIGLDLQETNLSQTKVKQHFLEPSLELWPTDSRFFENAFCLIINALNLTEFLPGLVNI